MAPFLYREEEKRKPGAQTRQTALYKSIMYPNQLKKNQSSGRAAACASVANPVSVSLLFSPVVGLYTLDDDDDDDGGKRETDRSTRGEKKELTSLSPTYTTSPFLLLPSFQLRHGKKNGSVSFWVIWIGEKTEGARILLACLNYLAETCLIKSPHVLIGKWLDGSSRRRSQ